MRHGSRQEKAREAWSTVFCPKTLSSYRRPDRHVNGFREPQGFEFATEQKRAETGFYGISRVCKLHFHLSRKPHVADKIIREKGFVDRSDYLLFAITNYRTISYLVDMQGTVGKSTQNLGWVKRAGSMRKIVYRTLGILKNLDQATARLFRTFCSACIFLTTDGKHILDARVSSLGSHAALNSLREYGLNFSALNCLNEHGLIIPDYNSWKDYQSSIRTTTDDETYATPFRFQGRSWILNPINERGPAKEFRLSGVELNQSGRELSQIVELETMDKLSRDLDTFFKSNNLQMTEVEIYEPEKWRITE